MFLICVFGGFENDFFANVVVIIRLVLYSSSGLRCFYSHAFYLLVVLRNVVNLFNFRNSKINFGLIMALLCGQVLKRAFPS